MNLIDLVLVADALVVLFYSILWAIGERDRLRIQRKLHEIVHLLERNGHDTGGRIDGDDVS